MMEEAKGGDRRRRCTGTFLGGILICFLNSRDWVPHCFCCVLCLLQLIAEVAFEEGAFSHL